MMQQVDLLSGSEAAAQLKTEDARVETGGRKEKEGTGARPVRSPHRKKDIHVAASPFFWNFSGWIINFTDFEFYKSNAWFNHLFLLGFILSCRDRHELRKYRQIILILGQGVRIAYSPY